MDDITWYSKVFLKFIRRAKSAGSNFSDFVTSIFRLNRRLITIIECVQPVELRGALWVDSKPIEGLINRRVLNMRPGQKAWLRVDEDEPFVTIENKYGCVNINKDKWSYEFRKYFQPIGNRPGNS